MKIAQVLYGKLHYIFEADEIPDWPPDQNGKPIVLIDVTEKTAEIGYGYNPVTEEIVPYPEVEEREGYIASVTWNEETHTFDVDYVEYVEPEPEPPSLQEEMQTVMEILMGVHDEELYTD